MSSALGRVAEVRSGPIDDAFATLVRRPDVISFAVGAPDPALLPGDLIASLAADAIAKYGSAALQYGLTQGFPPLLDQAGILLSNRGIGCRPEQLHIATGGSGALHNVCMALLAPGSVVLVETPTYGPAVKVFRSHGATVVAVESDDRGIMPDALDVALAQHDPAFVYLLPTFQNPTGRTMPTRRREQIAEVITRRGALVVEDDVYVDLRYWGESLPAFWSFAPEHTVYITSLSKTLAPALRIGIAVLTDNLREPVFALKQGIDMQTSAFNQAIAAEFLASPVGSAHLERVVAAYAAKLDTVVTALAKHFPAEFTWTVPDGGMFLWVDGPAGFDADALLGPALESGVAFLPGSAFFTDAAPRNAMRLSFAGAPLGEIDRGIAVLARLCELP
ncbi:PLP-dependent aminotransferase family protein [Nocardia sp. NBC_00565]|uniref:aminotransferase-like domain-containing protein n=1 Tax=Nocardia sp. NBC_00565 TaxID=2975993 RepID=UPI002E80DB13|nr:PLP-dependent aminotransferase family protein [Nocardia sp. NBC_00565]WUC00304.1 PLP-dependent aminotransferase family protein [Nocardia sp. NBC_00565]